VITIAAFVIRNFGMKIHIWPYFIFLFYTAKKILRYSITMKGFSSIVRSKYVFLLFLIFLCGFIYLGVAPAREGVDMGALGWSMIIIVPALIAFLAWNMGFFGATSQGY
jgi:hypothetical protein